MIYVLDPDPTGHGASIAAFAQAEAPSAAVTVASLSGSSPAARVAEYAAPGVVFVYAQTNPETFADAWEDAWARGAMTVVAHGSNTDGQVLADPPEMREWMICVGGETTADGSDTDDRSRGPGLMFDAITPSGLTFESWAAGVAAGALHRALAASSGDRRQALSRVLQCCSVYPERDDARGYGLLLPASNVEGAEPEDLPAAIVRYVEPAPAAPAAPVPTVARTGTSLSVTWPAVTGATSYRVRIAPGVGEAWAVDVTQTGTSYTATFAGAAVVTVVATNAGGTSSSGTAYAAASGRARVMAGAW